MPADPRIRIDGPRVPGGSFAISRRASSRTVRIASHSPISCPRRSATMVNYRTTPIGQRNSWRTFRVTRRRSGFTPRNRNIRGVKHRGEQKCDVVLFMGSLLSSRPAGAVRLAGAGASRPPRSARREPLSPTRPLPRWSGRLRRPAMNKGLQLVGSAVGGTSSSWIPETRPTSWP